MANFDNKNQACNVHVSWVVPLTVLCVTKATSFDILLPLQVLNLHDGCQEITSDAHAVSRPSSVYASLCDTALVRSRGAAQAHSFILSGHLVLFAQVTTTLSVYGCITQHCMTGSRN